MAGSENLHPAAEEKFAPAPPALEASVDPVREKLILGISLLLAAAGIVLATLFLPVAAGTGPEELRAVRLGRPLWFVVQDQSRYSPPGDVWTTRLLSPWRP
ncbi:MAG: hypothetical protein ACUVRC_07105 [Desulfotomaculales bacterium]